MDRTPDADPTPHDHRLANLRRWRNPKQRDLTLGGLPDYVKRHVEKPHKQVGQLVTVWERLIPEPLNHRTALAGLTRGILTVHVTDSPTLYELDRLLRGGVEQQIKRASKAPLRKIKLKIVERDQGERDRGIRDRGTRES